MLYQGEGDVDVELLSFRKQNAYDLVRTQRLTAQRGYHRTVFASGNGDYSVAAGTVFGEPLPYPDYYIIFDLFSVESFN